MNTRGVASALLIASGLAALVAGCGSGGGGTTPPPPSAYVLTVNSVDPASGVGIQVSPADNSGATNGATSFTRTYTSGTAVTLTAASSAGADNFLSWSGCTTSNGTTCNVTVSAATTVTTTYATPVAPTVTVTPASFAITTTQSLSVTIGVAGAGGSATPTGSVVLSSENYSSAATELASGATTITVPAGSLATGSDTLTATYTPDSASSAIYLTAAGTSSPVTVTAAAATTSITVDQSSLGPTVTDQLLGMNMAAWYDPTTTAVVPAFQTAGIKAVRWPGGSWSDVYHWSNNTGCGITPDSNATFPNFVNDLAIPGGFDVALTADYGTNAACNGPGDPTEAAAWVADAVTLKANVTHVTVGNEEYGSWETDMHAKPNDAATYANATATGYYPDIKAADSSVLVGVSVNPGNDPPWDPIVLANAKYDFVEVHFYPQAPGSESDTFITQQAAQELTATINTIKSELATAGHPDIPIYVGEMGSVYTNPGKQSMSITQGLYAGQTLGEMMNDGVSRATWWIGFGNCNSTNGNDSSSLYGWQDFGAYNVFADGPDDPDCAGAGPIGTLSPTARAFQLFSKVAVTGESVLTANVTGDTTDVRAYAATNNGGTALVLFNLNERAAEPVAVTLSQQTSSSAVTVETYSKAIYDETNAPTPVWADPTTSTLGAQSLPLTLTLDPWSMNVVIIQ